MRLRGFSGGGHMRVTKVVFVAGAVVSVVAALVLSPVSSPDLNAANQAAAPLTCNLTQYRASTGLTTALDGGLLTVSWNGQGTAQLRARFAIDGGTPTIRDLSVRRGSGEWAMLGQNLTPEYQVTTGVRRMSNDQANAFSSLGIDVTPELMDKHKWYTFWDAPFSVPDTTPHPPAVAGEAAVRPLRPSRSRSDRAAPYPSRSQPSSRGRAADRASTRRRTRPASLAVAVSVCQERRRKSAAAYPCSRRHPARSRATAPASR